MKNAGYVYSDIKREKQPMLTLENLEPKMISTFLLKILLKNYGSVD